MKILEPGHKYIVDSLDGDQPQTITFVKREGERYPFNVGNHPGTNCQEILRVLIDRTQYLNSQVPCAETESIIECLKTALLLFELRAARHHGRHLELETTQRLLCGPTCRQCGHVGCRGHVDRAPPSGGK